MEEPEDLSDREPVSCELVRVVLVVSDVVDVLMFPSVALIGNFWNRSPFSFSKSVNIVVQIRRKR